MFYHNCFPELQLDVFFGNLTSPDFAANISVDVKALWAQVRQDLLAWEHAKLQLDGSACCFITAPPPQFSFFELHLLVEVRPNKSLLYFQASTFHHSITIFFVAALAFAEAALPFIEGVSSGKDGPACKLCGLDLDWV